METESSSVEFDGHSIAYRESGRGPALLLLHGFLCDSRCWEPQLAGLSRNFRVVAWDAPGAGASSDPPETFATADYVRCLAGFMDSLAIGGAHILGLSWGGILAQEFYRAYPERARSLVLADTYAGWRGSLSDATWRERLETCLRDSNAEPAEVVARMLPGMLTENIPEDLRERLYAIMTGFHPVGFRVMARSSAETDTRDLLPRIRVPTLLLWGGRDRRSPIEIAHRLRSVIPSAELAVIGEAGHISNMERAEVFNAHVARFCGSLGP